jgi:hypothetical protein
MRRPYTSLALAWTPVIAGLFACDRDLGAASREATPTRMPPSAAVASTALPLRAAAWKDAGAPPATAPAALASAPSSGQEIAIEARTVRLGSPTGSAHRNPAREADDVPVTLTAFAIDALPYPNDPALPARTGSSRPEAEKLCREQGKRLCSELEWELACKGPNNADYPSAGDFASCAEDAARCASAFGVFALGTLGREWTGSPAGPGDWDRLRTAVVRGAAPDAEAKLHRCAARDAAMPESRSDTLLFRCCRGASQGAIYTVEREPPAFRELTMTSDALRTTLRAMPETRDLADSFRLYGKGAQLAALTIAGRTTQSLPPWQAASPAFAWSPLRGEELILLAGDSQAGAAIVAYYPSPRGPLFAGSFVTKDEHAPILVAYKDDAREELLYSTCWGCGGEGGALRLDASARLRFVPR